jgi:hypothetical protein
MQLADELEVKQEMAKADQGCWTELEKQFEQIWMTKTKTMLVKMKG